ncbi:alpha-1,2-fucosyltransferase [Microbacterium plantarum]|uniref:alpha-1,2-fucosyltransferase n=1 Tax=Microbacterium plantarum TaxID=1816425 RepID=UPI002B474456|nr:alpha-1,2-fucosyltransferase [Microbacterium plantarum]WRK16646.1 alpha-1,2-fucosyltransferase [Microbacterium plantarum]
MNSRRDGITGYIAGGLGNQLFILGAAWEQAERLGCPLYLDASHFRVEGTRGFEVDALATPARTLDPSESWRSLRLNSERVLPFPNRLGRIYLERDADRYADTIDQVRPGTTLVGYFQSRRYFPTVAPRLIDAMLAMPETEAESSILARMRAEPAITLHLRRGDYLAVPTARQFIASVDYAKRALALTRDLGLDLPVRVFSDSVDLVRDELAGVDAQFDFVADDGSLSIWSTLKAMSEGTAMIMSNSSFSWWAATLMARRPEKPPVIIGPRPWTSSGTAKADLLEAGWITLDAR